MNTENPIWGVMASINMHRAAQWIGNMWFGND